MEDLFKSSKAKALLALGCLCLGLIVLFWPVFFQGKVLVPGDIANTDPLIMEGVRVPHPQNLLLSDQIEQFYVMHSVAAQSLREEGRLPLWNPYFFTGQPLLANAQSSLYYPPNLLLRFLSPGKVATVRVFFNLLFAGFFTFLFCRKLDISTRGSLLAAVSFAFSGPSLVWVGFPLANVLACLPFLMWAGERLVRRRDALSVVLLGAGMGLSLLAGHPETSFQILAIFSCYFLARLALAEGKLRDKGWTLGGYLLAVLLGGLLSGVQVLPFLDFMLHSSTFARGGRASDAGANPFYSGEWLANLATAFTLFCPNFFGNPLDRSYIWPFGTFQNYNEQAVYFGMVPMALAGGALFAAARRKPMLIVACLAALCLSVAWHLPGFEVVSHLPIFSMAPNKRLRLPFVFLTAVLSGYGYDLLLRHLSGRAPEKRSFYAALSVLALGVLLFVWIVTLKFTIGPSVPPESFRHLLLYNVFSFGNWRTFLPLFVSVAALVVLLAGRRSVRGASLLLLALTVLELFGLGWGYNPAVPEAEILPPARAVDFMKQREHEPFRILTTDGLFFPNFPAAYGLSDVGGYDVPVYQRYSDLYLAQGGPSFGGQIDSRQQWDPSWPLVDFLNVKYVATPRTLNDQKYQQVYQGRSFRIYQNRQALPRAFVAYQAETVPDAKALLDRMVGRRDDLSRKVLLEEPLAAPLPAPEASARNSVRWLRNTPDEVALDVSSDRPGLLVMSDLYTPDWSATVDGREVKLYRADYSYRALPLPQGSHAVLLRYRPASYRIGAALSLAGLILGGAGALYALRRGKRRDESQPQAGDPEVPCRS